MEGWEDIPRPFCVTRIADPFGDIDRPPYDAARNLTETGGLPELFAELPNAHGHESGGNDEAPRRAESAQPAQHSLSATEVTAATRIVAEPAL